MRINGVETAREEIVDLKAIFPASLGALLLAKITLKLKRAMGKYLMEPSSSMETMRFAQGYLTALRDFEGDVRWFLKLDLSELEKNEDRDETEEQNEEEIIDVGF